MMAKKLHKLERSSASHAILDAVSRQRKAAKIEAVLSRFIDISSATILDIGSGSGHIPYELAKKAKHVESIDRVDERREKRGYGFQLANDETIPHKDAIFDIVITNHVIEHTPNQRRHLDEALRVLKPGGYIYLATPNKYWLTDPHYKLAFVAWLPRPVSSWYVALTRRMRWDIYPVSVFWVKKHTRACRLTNALPLLLTTPAAKKLDTWRFATRLAKFVPRRLLNATEYLSPTLIYIIQKPEN